MRGASVKPQSPHLFSIADPTSLRLSHANYQVPVISIHMLGFMAGLSLLISLAIIFIRLFVLGSFVLAAFPFFIATLPGTILLGIVSLFFGSLLIWLYGPIMPRLRPWRSGYFWLLTPDARCFFLCSGLPWLRGAKSS